LKTLTEAQIRAIKCAYADLAGALQSHNQCDPNAHDWEAHLDTITELEEAFDFIEPVKNLGEPDDTSTVNLPDEKLDTLVEFGNPDHVLDLFETPPDVDEDTEM
jgi:hypothetical protein